MSQRIRATAALLALVLCACRPTSAAPPVEAPVRAPERAAELVGDPGEHAFWWAHLGPTSAATVWIGPPVRSEDGALWRPWAMTVHRPGFRQPLVVFQATVANDRSDPIGGSDPAYELRLRPRAGLAWKAVTSQEELEVVVEGLD